MGLLLLLLLVYLPKLVLILRWAFIPIPIVNLIIIIQALIVVIDSLIILMPIISQSPLTTTV